MRDDSPRPAILKPDEFPDTFLPNVAKAADEECEDVLRKLRSQRALDHTRGGLKLDHEARR